MGQEIKANKAGECVWGGERDSGLDAHLSHHFDCMAMMESQPQSTAQGTQAWGAGWFLCHSKGLLYSLVSGTSSIDSRCVEGAAFERIQISADFKCYLAVLKIPFCLEPTDLCDRPLETSIPSLQGSFPTLLCSRAPCGLSTPLLSEQRVQQVRNRKQDKSSQSFLQESFHAHSGMAGKQCLAGKRLLLLMGQIHSYLSGKEFPPIRNFKMSLSGWIPSSLKLRRLQRWCFLSSELWHVSSSSPPGSPSRTQCAIFALLMLLTGKVTSSICLGFFVVVFPERWCFLSWSLLDSI